MNETIKTKRYLLPAHRRADLDALLTNIAILCHKDGFSMTNTYEGIDISSTRDKFPPIGNYEYHVNFDGVDESGRLVQNGKPAERIEHEEIQDFGDDDDVFEEDMAAGFE